MSESRLNDMARDYINRMQDLRGPGYTELFADWWMKLHQEKMSSDFEGRFTEVERDLLAYMMIGEHSPISDPLASKWAPVFTEVSDENGPLVRDSRQTRLLERAFGWPALLIADEVARRCAHDRILRGVASKYGHPLACYANMSNRNGTVLTAFAFSQGEESGCYAVVDRQAAKIYLISDWANNVVPILALRNLVADPSAPEFGYAIEWNLVVMLKKQPYALLDNPYTFLNCWKFEPDRLWFVGKGHKYSSDASKRLKKSENLMPLIFEHALSFYQSGVSNKTRSDIDAWFTAVSAANLYQVELDPKHDGVPAPLLKAVVEAGEALMKKHQVWSTSMSMAHFADFPMSERRKSRAVADLGSNSISLLPDEIREAEASRYLAASLHKSTGPALSKNRKSRL